MNPLDLVKFVEAHLPEGERLNALALLSDAPGEDYQLKASLPTMNELPAFRVGGQDFGNTLANLNYGLAAPVLGQEQPTTEKSIGELLVGDIDG